jgi:hypothetical protein
MDAQERTEAVDAPTALEPATVSSANDARCNTPALLTSAVSAPNRSTVAATACCRWSADVVERDRDHGIVDPSMLEVNSSASRSHAATRTPSEESRLTMAAPCRARHR